MNKRYLLELLEKFVANLRADIDHENLNERKEANLCAEIPSKRIKKEHVSASTFEAKIKFFPESNILEMDNFQITVVDKSQPDIKVKRESLKIKEEIFENDFLNVGISMPNPNQDVQPQSTSQTSGRKRAADGSNDKGHELPGPSTSDSTESLNKQTSKSESSSFMGLIFKIDLESSSTCLSL
jgi:hypothetical protein